VVETVTERSFTAAMVDALETAWAAIQRVHPDVPDVVLTIGSGTVGRPAGKVTLGHFAPDRWERVGGKAPELFIGGEGLSRGAPDVLATLLHEAAHGAAHRRGIKDTSRQGRYHNTKRLIGNSA
jgi:hypothetical protein